MSKINPSKFVRGSEKSLGVFFDFLYNGKSEEGMELNRVSTSIFSYGKTHLIRYNRNTHYMECTCPDSILAGKCEFMGEARKILEGEGFTVKFKRVPKLPFDEEREKFRASVEKVIGVC